MIQDDNFWRRRVNLLHPRLVWKLPHTHRTWMSYCQHLFNCQLFSVTVDGKYLLHVPIEKTFSSLLRLSKYKFYQTFTTVWLLNLYGSLTETYEFTDYPSSSKHDGNTLGPRIFIRSRNELNETSQVAYITVVQTGTTTSFNIVLGKSYFEELSSCLNKYINKWM